MCGIIGYCGNGIVEKEIINGLQKLEYRGYDSSGILTVLHNKFNIVKSVGKIEDLDKKITNYSNSICGIGHTRWATHGKVSEINAHPHYSNDRLYGIVHNGIIENYSQLKENILKNYTFYSETDTEVIANLFEYNHKKTDILTEKDVMFNIIKSSKQLKGSYSLCSVCSQFNDVIFLAKNKSPLYVATNKKESLIGSDVCCFDKKFDDYYELNDYEFAIVYNNHCEFYDINCNRIEKKSTKLTSLDIISNIDKSKSYMLNEIYQIPSVLKNILDKYKDGKIFSKIKKDFNNIVFIGCGTAYHACRIGRMYINEFSDIETHSYIASEFNCNKKHIDKNTLCLFVSQSGETFDTLEALKFAKSKRAKTIAITNVTHSTLSKKCRYVFPLFAGPEIAVASTKAYNCQLLILLLFAYYMFNNDDYKKFIKSAYKQLKKFNIKKLSEIIYLKDLIKNSSNLFLLGKNYDYISACESSLKIKEITYLTVESHPSGELKHGYIALIDKNSTAIIINTQKSLFTTSLMTCSEIKARDGKVVLLTSCYNKKDSLPNVDYLIKLPNVSKLFAPILSIIPLQLLSEKISRDKGINPDKPKNLAKSVTVQ